MHFCKVRSSSALITYTFLLSKTPLTLFCWDASIKLNANSNFFSMLIFNPTDKRMENNYFYTWDRDDFKTRTRVRP